MKTKKQLIVVLSCLIVILVLCISIKLVNTYALKKYSNNIDRIYGTVLSYNNGLLNIKTLDNDEITVISNAKYDEGDFLLIEYYTVGKDNLTSIEKIADGSELNKLSSLETTTITTTTTKATTTKTTTTKTTTTKKNQTTTTTTSTTTIYVDDKDNAILSELSLVNDNVDDMDSSSKDDKKSAKEYVIKLIDFVFYDGEINNIKFNDLTDSAKEKVIYYSLMIDNKLDNIFPGYKDDVATNYQNAKAKLVAKYLDIATNICSSNEKQCSLIKDDFNTLKTSVSITWDFIKTSIQYGLDISTNSLKNWYEVWSGK